MFFLLDFAYYSAMFESMGTAMEVTKYKEKLVPSTRFVSVDGIAPAVSGSNNFVAPSASIIGNVSIGQHSRYGIINVLKLFAFGNLSYF
jgi:hypothetical protein